MLYPCLLVVALAAVTVSAGPNAAGIAFLKENAEKEGVGTVIRFAMLYFFLASSCATLTHSCAIVYSFSVSLPSGVQYKVLKKGHGNHHPTVNR